ncbi:MAG: DUF4430 domain-containing protein [Leptonema sp. (in: bacteria)]
MKKNIKAIGIVLLTLLLLGNCQKEKEVQKNNREIHIEFIIWANEKEDTLHLNLDQPKSVIEIMNQLKEEKKIAFDVQNYNDLSLVTSINNFKNEKLGKNKKNWIYSVNGKLVPISVNQYMIKESSKIKWCYIEWENRTQCGEEINNLDEKKK